MYIVLRIQADDVLQNGKVISQSFYNQRDICTVYNIQEIVSPYQTFDDLLK